MRAALVQFEIYTQWQTVLNICCARLGMKIFYDRLFYVLNLYFRSDFFGMLVRKYKFRTQKSRSQKIFIPKTHTRKKLLSSFGYLTVKITDVSRSRKVDVGKVYQYR